MYRWILSSFRGIKVQYWLTSGAKRRRRPVLHLNSEEWRQYSPIHPTQTYRNHIVVKWKPRTFWLTNAFLVLKGSTKNQHCRIKMQYWPPPSLRSGGQPILHLNSSEWRQYSPIHPPQTYRIPSVHRKLEIDNFLWKNAESVNWQCFSAKAALLSIDFQWLKN